MALTREESTRDIIGAAIEVHRELGPGYLESIYERSLCNELRLRGIAFENQVVVPILYKGGVVGDHRLDVLVHDEVVVELKAAAAIAPIHLVVMRSYLRATGLTLGLILNFARSTLEVKRVLIDKDA